MGQELPDDAEATQTDGLQVRIPGSRLPMALCSSLLSLEDLRDVSSKGSVVVPAGGFKRRA